MTRIVVMHEGYGCETGCCGHVVRVEGEVSGRRRFHFDHPYDLDSYPEGPEREAYLRGWAEDLLRRELGDEHVADLDWANSEVHFSDDYC